MIASFAGIAAGVAAASCCLVPFLLFLAGVGGAWIGSLTALEPYRPYFAGIGVLSIGYGFLRVYRRRAGVCGEAAYCARPAARRATKIGLWSAAALVAVALVSPYLIAMWL